MPAPSRSPRHEKHRFGWHYVDANYKSFTAMIALRDRILPWTALSTSVACIFSFTAYLYASANGHLTKGDLDLPGFQAHDLFAVGLVFWLFSAAVVAIARFRGRTSTKVTLVASILWGFVAWTFSAFGVAALLGLYFDSESRSQFSLHSLLFLLFFALFLGLAFLFPVQIARDILKLSK